MSSSAEQVTRNLRWVSLCTLLSRVLGLVRDAAMAARFGNGPLLDAFTVAFRIPNLARALLGEGALATAFLPAYIREREALGRAAANRLATAVSVALSLTLLAGIIATEVVLIVGGWLFDWAPGSELLRQLLIWLTPYVGAICLAAQFGGMLNAEGRFVIPALVPAILNLLWLVGLWLVVPLWSDPRQQLFAMAGCVLAGGMAQLLTPLPAMFRAGFALEVDWKSAWPGVKRIAGQMVPVVGGLMITQINVLLDSLVAWGFSSPVEQASPLLEHDWRYPLTSGTASALYFGQRLYQFPLGVFGVALGTVLFPLLAEHAQSRQFDRLREDFTLGLRYVAAIGIPASAGLMLLGDPLTSLCFEYGAFTADDARQTAQMITAYGSGVWAYCGLLLVHRGFYAVGDRLTPMRIGLFAVILNVLLNLTLIWVVGGVGLALSTAVVSMLQCLLAGEMFRRKIGGWQPRAVSTAVVKALAASTVMWLSAWGMLLVVEPLGGWSGRGLRVVGPFAVAVVAYFSAAWVLGFSEPWDVLRRRKSPGAVPRDSGAEDV